MKIDTFVKAIGESKVAVVEQGLKESPKLANQVYQGYLSLQTAVYQLKIKKNESPAVYTKLLDQRLAIIVLMIKHGAQSLVIYDELGFNVFQMALYRACYLYNDRVFEAAHAHLTIANTIYEEAQSKNDKAAISKIQESVNDLLVTGNGKLVGTKQTLFHMAVYFGYSVAVNLILKIRPNPTILNEFELNALHLSILAYAHSAKLDEKSNSKQLDERKKERVQIVNSILDFFARNPSLGYQNTLSHKWKGVWPVINDPIIISQKYKTNTEETPLNSATTLRCTELVDVLNRYEVKFAVQQVHSASTSAPAVALQQAIAMEAPVKQQVVTIVRQDDDPTLSAIPAVHVGSEAPKEANDDVEVGVEPGIDAGNTDTNMFSSFLENNRESPRFDK